MRQLKKTKPPVILTVNGKAEAYQRLLDIAARADVQEAIRRVFGEIRQKRGIPR